MKELLGSRFLINRWTGQEESADIFYGLDEKNYSDFEKLWKPALDRRRAEFADWDAAAKGNVQDAHWDWLGKAKAEGRYEAFAIECDGQTQGMMLIDIAPRFARLKSHLGLELSYVELIASAPWNRKDFSDKPKYKGAGLALMGTAVSFSVDLEAQGRLALHSLPESETWYHDLGFTDCGYDTEKDMRYFELTSEKAAELFSTN